MWSKPQKTGARVSAPRNQGVAYYKFGLQYYCIIKPDNKSLCFFFTMTVLKKTTKAFWCIVFPNWFLQEFFWIQWCCQVHFNYYKLVDGLIRLLGRSISREKKFACEFNSACLLLLLLLLVGSGSNRVTIEPEIHSCLPRWEPASGVRLTTENRDSAIQTRCGKVKSQRSFEPFAKSFLY